MSAIVTTQKDIKDGFGESVRSAAGGTAAILWMTP
jgi:hypothetical protein